MKKCPYCAEEIQDEAIRCKHCRSDLPGSVSVLPPEVVGPAPAVVAVVAAPVGPAGPSCLGCGSAEVRKISAIYKGGTWTAVSEASATGVAIYGGGLAVGAAGASVASAGGTQLAAALAPPPKPTRGGSVALGAIPFGLIALFAGIVWANNLGNYFGSAPAIITVGAVLGTLVCLIKGAADAPRLEAEHARAMVAWRDQGLVWERLVFCSRCGAVTDHETAQSAPLQKLNDLLMRVAGQHDKKLSA